MAFNHPTRKEIEAGNPKHRLETQIAILHTPQSRDHKGVPQEGFNSGNLARDIDELLPTPTAKDHGSRTPNPDGRYLSQVAATELAIDWGKYTAAIERWESITGHPVPMPTEPSPRRTAIRDRLAATFVEWLMGLPPGWVTDVPGLTRIQKLQILGNGVVPQQAELALDILLAAERKATSVTATIPLMTEADSLQMIAVDDLHPHPSNPRIAIREDVIEGIASEIKRKGAFDVAYALKVKPLPDGGYQVVSGHNRRLAAIRAGVEKVPCWVDIDLTDDEAFMQLVLSNSQAELSPLEIGFHALTYEAGGGVLTTYATDLGRDKSYVTQLRGAAKVAQGVETSQHSELITKTWQLYEISKAPEEVQTLLVTKMLGAKWTVADTVDHVKSVRELNDALVDSGKRPHERWLPFLDITAAHLDTGKYGAASVKRLTTAATETARWMRSAFGDDGDHEVRQFFDWLVENKGADAWDARKILEFKRAAEARLAAKDEAQYVAAGWYHGDWHQYVNELQEGRAALILTDPPYGASYRSNMRKDKHDFISGDEDMETASELLRDALTTLKPKLSKDAHVLVFCSWRTEESLRQAIIAAGYDVRGSLVWCKQAPGLGDLEGSFSPSHERIIHATIGSPVIYRRINDVLHFSRVKSDIHPTEKPVDLLAELIGVTTAENELVLDPFAGVASTAVAAKVAGRRWWACELEEKYFRAGEERLLSKED